MSLDALGNIGEIVGAIAVVVSLFYLLLQLRQNTQSIRSATHQAVVSAAAATNQALAGDPGLARILRLGIESPGELDADEQVRFAFLCMQFFDLFENLHLQALHGVLDDDFWQPRRRAFLRLLASDGFRTVWSEKRFDYSGRFRAMVDAGLEATPPSASAAVGLDAALAMTRPPARAA